MAAAACWCLDATSTDATSESAAEALDDIEPRESIAAAYHATEVSPRHATEMSPRYD